MILKTTTCCKTVQKWEKSSALKRKRSLLAAWTATQGSWMWTGIVLLQWGNLTAQLKTAFPAFIQITVGTVKVGITWFLVQGSVTKKYLLFNDALFFWTTSVLSAWVAFSSTRALVIQSTQTLNARCLDASIALKTNNVLNARLALLRIQHLEA